MPEYLEETKKLYEICKDIKTEKYSELKLEDKINENDTLKNTLFKAFKKDIEYIIQNIVNINLQDQVMFNHVLGSNFHNINSQNAKVFFSNLRQRKPELNQALQRYHAQLESYNIYSTLKWTYNLLN